MFNNVIIEWQAFWTADFGAFRKIRRFRFEAKLSIFYFWKVSFTAFYRIIFIETSIPNSQHVFRSHDIIRFLTFCCYSCKITFSSLILECFKWFHKLFFDKQSNNFIFALRQLDKQKIIQKMSAEILISHYNTDNSIIFTKQYQISSTKENSSFNENWKNFQKCELTIKF